MISDLGYNLLIDSGDGICKALLLQNIKYNSINGILFSHLHPDHYSGYAALIVQMIMNHRNESLSVFVHHTLINTLKDFLRSSYVFTEKMDFPVNYTGFNFDEEISVISGLSFISRQNTHLQEYEKYDSSLSYACGSFLFKHGGKNIYYSGDIGSVKDLLLFKDFKIDLLITETAHVSLDEIINAVELLNPGKVILTHLTEKIVPELKSGVENIKNKPFIIANDGLFLSV
jgi:ribonuclease BN (tRNA processing enzyme)